MIRYENVPTLSRRKYLQPSIYTSYFVWVKLKNLKCSTVNFRNICMKIFTVTTDLSYGSHNPEYKFLWPSFGISKTVDSFPSWGQSYSQDFHYFYKIEYYVLCNFFVEKLSSGILQSNVQIVLLFSYILLIRF